MGEKGCLGRKWVFGAEKRFLCVKRGVGGIMGVFWGANGLL